MKLLCVHDPPVQLLLLGLVVSEYSAFERVHPVQQIIKGAPQSPDVQRSSAEFSFCCHASLLSQASGGRYKRVPQS
jgi:hypothetical protein